jgi:hypothetical protein
MAGENRSSPLKSCSPTSEPGYCMVVEQHPISCESICPRAGTPWIVRAFVDSSLSAAGHGTKARDLNCGDRSENGCKDKIELHQRCGRKRWDDVRGRESAR